MSTSFHRNEIQYYQNSLISMGSRDEIFNTDGYLYDNSDSSKMYPMCDILVEVTTPIASPEKIIKLYKISGININNYQLCTYYKNALLRDDLQPYFIDCNSKHENFQISSSYTLNEDTRYQYYMFSRIFLSPVQHLFYFKYDADINFNSYLIPYTLSM